MVSEARWPAPGPEGRWGSDTNPYPSDEVFRADERSNPAGRDKADAHAFLALCHLELGDLGKTAKHADIALAANSTYFWAVLYDGRVKVASGRAEEAVHLLEALAARSPDHPETLHALSRAHAALGREKEARATLADAIDAVPDGHPWQTRLRALWEEELSP